MIIQIPRGKICQIKSIFSTFLSSPRPGPNSPLKWMKECIKALTPKANSPIRKKLFVGLNFYGFDYSPTGGSAIVGSQ